VNIGVSRSLTGSTSFTLCAAIKCNHYISTRAPNRSHGKRFWLTVRQNPLFLSASALGWTKTARWDIIPQKENRL